MGSRCAHRGTVRKGIGETRSKFPAKGRVNLASPFVILLCLIDLPAPQVEERQVAARRGILGIEAHRLLVGLQRVIRVSCGQLGGTQKVVGYGSAIA